LSRSSACLCRIRRCRRRSSSVFRRTVKERGADGWDRVFADSFLGNSSPLRCVTRCLHGRAPAVARRRNHSAHEEPSAKNRSG